MLSGPPSNHCPVQSVLGSGLEEGGSADQAHAPSPFFPSGSDADKQDTSPASLTGSVASAQAPKTPLSNSGPTVHPLRLHSQGILKQPAKTNQASQNTGPSSLNRLVAGNNERAVIALEILRNICWSGGDEQTVSSSATATTTSPSSPKSHLTRQPSANIEASPACFGQANDNHSRQELPAHESLARVESTGMLRTEASINFARSETSSLSELSSVPSTRAPSPAASSEDECEDKPDMIQALLPATEPDETGQYESSTCHQCHGKNSRPKMICNQSRNPHCGVRVCHRCLMVRGFYDNVPELRPPQFEFVPGGRMLCVKCRNICACTPCRRRRGEQFEVRRRRSSALSKTSSKQPPLPKKKPTQGKTSRKWGPRRRPDLLMNAQPCASNQLAAFPLVRDGRTMNQVGSGSNDMVILHPSAEVSLTDTGQISKASIVGTSAQPAEPGQGHQGKGKSCADQFPSLKAENIAHKRRGRGRPRKYFGDQFPSLKDKNSVHKRRGRGRPRKDEPRPDKPAAPKYIPLDLTKRRNDYDSTLINQPEPSEAASDMTSSLNTEQNASGSKATCQNILPQAPEEQQQKLDAEMGTLELQNMLDDLGRQKARTEAFERARMMQDFLRSGLSYEKALEATLMFLGPPSS